MAESIPACPSATSRSGRLRWLLAATPALIMLLSAFVPLARQLTSNDIDWPILLDELHVRGAAFGREVVFTFGPWGFVWAAASPRTLPIACAVWAILAVIVWWTLVQLARARFPRSPMIAGAIVLGLA